MGKPNMQVCLGKKDLHEKKCESNRDVFIPPFCPSFKI